MGLGEASASCGQDEKGSEDVRFQQVTGKINKVQKMLDRFHQVMNKINRTLKVQDKLQQVMGNAE